MNKIKTIIAVALLSLSASAVAQDLESAYFTDGYLFRHEMNPAIANEKGYFSMPALGNFNLDVRGTLGLSDVLYNVNGRTVTFLNPNVPTSEVLGNIDESNKFGTNIKMQILGFGFKAFGGYNTFGVNVRGDVNADVPGTFLRAAKEGLTNTTYDMSNMGVHAHAFGEVALGHSHQIGEKLRVGAKVKFLVGVGNIDANFKKAKLTLGEDNVSAEVNAEVNVNAKDFKFDHDINENTNHKYVSGIDDMTLGVAGTGFAFDFGAEYKVINDLTVSASIVDLGSIKYKQNVQATTNGSKTFNTNAYTIDTDDADATFDKMQDDLSKLYELDDKGDTGSKSVGLGATLRVGAEYKFPLYRKLSFGALYASRFGEYSWSEIRVSANVAPVKCFSAGVNVATGTYGMGFGGILNFHTTGFNLFVAMDRTLGSLSKQYIPLNSNASVTFGLNFPF